MCRTADSTCEAASSAASAATACDAGSRTAPASQDGKKRRSGSGSSSDSTSESDSSHERKKRARKSKKQKREKQERHERREKKRKKERKRKKHAQAKDEGEPVQRSVITGEAPMSKAERHCREQPRRGVGQRLRPPAVHAPLAPDQAQGGLQPRPASARLGQPRPASASLGQPRPTCIQSQRGSGGPALPALGSTQASGSSGPRARSPTPRARRGGHRCSHGSTGTRP